MKSEWETKKIGEVVDIRRGSSPRPIHKFLASEGMPWVKIADATSDTSRYIWKTNEFIIDDGVNKSVKVAPETLIVSNSATPGLPKIMKITACVHDGWLVFSNYRGITRDFLYYKFIDIRRQLVNQANGSVFQNLKTDIVKDFDIDIPSNETQKKIVGILSNIDEKIELNNAINNNLEQQAQAIYQQMFIENRNVNWKKGKLSDLVVVKYGKDHKKLDDGCYPVYGSGGIMRYVEKPLYTGESVLIPRKGTLNNVMYVNGAFWSVDTMFYTEMLRPNIAKFVYHFVKGIDLASLNAGSAVPSMTTNILNAMQLYIPDDETLCIFEETVTPMYAQMQENDKQSVNLAKLRDTLLPRLMSGELDVSDIDL